MVNVLESVRPKTVHVTAFGHLFLLEAVSAWDWIGAIGAEQETLAGVFPGMAADRDLDVLLGHALDDDFARRCTNTARSALGKGAGRDWWWALNLTSKILSAFSAFNGVMLREGVPLSTPFPDYLDAVYSLLWERGDDEARMKLDLELQVLPKGVAVRQSAAATKNMAAAFAAD